MLWRKRSPLTCVAIGHTDTISQGNPAGWTERTAQEIKMSATTIRQQYAALRKFTKEIKLGYTSDEVTKMIIRKADELAPDLHVCHPKMSDGWDPRAVVARPWTTEGAGGWRSIY
jgi:hypothetical protein